MLVNDKKQVCKVVMSETDRALTFVKDHPIELFLTGSRYFSVLHHLPNTDWDFFCLKNEHNRQALIAAGFKKVHDKGYQNLCELEALYKMGHVHVQLVTDVLKKNIIQEIIHDQFGMTLNTFTKDQRRKIWRTAYQCYNRKK